MNKEEAIREAVNMFFREYTRRITLSETGKTPEQLEPKMLKQAMLEHYEEVATEFHLAVYPKIAEINGLSQEIPNKITPDTMRDICVSEALFDVMADAYRQNFMSLLQGRLLNNVFM